jgi:hypothetical protein
MRVILKDDSMQKAYKYKAGVRICFHYHSFLILHLAKEIFNHPYTDYSKPKGRSKLSAHAYHSDIRAVSVMTPPADGNEVAAKLLEDDKPKLPELLLFLFKSMPGITDALYKTERAQLIRIYNQVLQLCEHDKGLIEYFWKVTSKNTFERQGRIPHESDKEVDRPFDAGNHIGATTGRRWIVAIFAAALECCWFLDDAPDKWSQPNEYREHVKNFMLEKKREEEVEPEWWVPAMKRCWSDAVLVESKHFIVDPPLSGELPAKD